MNFSFIIRLNSSSEILFIGEFTTPSLVVINPYGFLTIFIILSLFLGIIWSINSTFFNSSITSSYDLDPAFLINVNWYASIYPRKILNNCPASNKLLIIGVPDKNVNFKLSASIINCFNPLPLTPGYGLDIALVKLWTSSIITNLLSNNLVLFIESNFDLFKPSKCKNVYLESIISFICVSKVDWSVSINES